MLPSVLLTIQEPGSLGRAAILRVVEIMRRQEPRLRGSLEINLVGNRVIRNLNYKFRGLNRPTDVLSFAWGKSAAPLATEPLGTLYLAPRYIKAQARRFGAGSREEFTRSLAHGLLHLAGRDHVKINDAKIMFARQEHAVAIALKKSRLP